jgi:hypothetical protein
VKLDVIIPLSNLVPESREERLKTLNFSLREFYAKQTGVDIRVTLVEQMLDDSTYYIQNITVPDGLNVSRMVIDYPQFNKGWCFNTAVRAGCGPLIMLAEADMVCFHDYLSECLEWFQQKQLRWAFAWERLYYADEEEKALILDNKPIGHIWRKRLTQPQRGYSEGGLVLYNTDFYKDIGWSNEWVKELGGVDNELAERAFHASGQYEYYPQRVFHLWHQQVRKSSRPSRKVNKGIVRFVRAHPKAAIRFLRKQEPGQQKAPLCDCGMNFFEAETKGVKV